MDRQGIGRACLALPHVTLDHPFGDEHDVYRIGGKMFVIVGETGGVSFKVSDIAYAVLTEDGRALPAPYLARAKWVNLPDPAAWPQDELIEHFAIARRLIGAKLTRRMRDALALD